MTWAPHTVALTGVTGMVGRHIAAVLERAGISCCGITRSQWDFRSWASDDHLERLFGTADAVVHAGATVPSPGLAVSAKEILDANVRACFCLGDWARRRGIPLVFISGATVYGSVEKIGILETDAITTRPVSGLYGLSKLLAEQLLDNLVGQGLKLCVLRPSSVYGAGMQETRMVATMLAKARRNEEICLRAPVHDRVNLIHAGDLAAAVAAALKAQAWDVFNVAGAETVSVAEIAAACVGVTGSGRVVVPTEAGGDGVLRYQLDYTKASTAFGYAPQVSLLEGLACMLAGSVDSVSNPYKGIAVNDKT